MLRDAKGDGYVESLWQQYPHISPKADYVMYWWDRAAELTRSKQIKQFGLITTNSISQVFQQRVLGHHLRDADPPLHMFFAISDHPWVDDVNAAAVRVAMTAACGEKPRNPVVGTVLEGQPDHETANVSYRYVDRINVDLSTGSELDKVKAMHANDLVFSQGVQLYGSGFILNHDDAESLLHLATTDAARRTIRPYMNGRDLARQSRGAFVIDFFGYEEAKARQVHPAAFQRILDRVKPERDHNRRESIRRKWWRFGWERPVLRNAVLGLRRYIVTPETAKHRFFVFLDADYLPDNMLSCVATEDAMYLGTLSSRVHVTWALAVGGTLEDRPRYTKGRCFDPFPFPACSPDAQELIRNLAEQLDSHRKLQQMTHPKLTLTDMYNVLVKLRAGETLAEKERVSPGPVTPEDLAKQFMRGKADQVEDVLEALCSLGMARTPGREPARLAAAIREAYAGRKDSRVAHARDVANREYAAPVMGRRWSDLCQHVLHGRLT